MVASYRTPKAEVRPSGVEGRGLVARESIGKGEVVAIKGGHVVDQRTFEENAGVIGDSDIQIADGFYLVPLSAEEHDAVMMFLNHSCEPNAGVMGNIVFVAMRDIAPGEEITIDYAMIDDGDFTLECRCGASSCRGTISGRDWTRPELQEKYGGYFSAYLMAKFRP